MPEKLTFAEFTLLAILFAEEAKVCPFASWATNDQQSVALRSLLNRGLIDNSVTITERGIALIHRMLEVTV